LTPGRRDGTMPSVRDSKGGAIHVGVNAHLLSWAESYRSAGLSWYSQNLLRNLPGADPEIRFTAFVGERRYPGVPGLELKLSRWPTHSPLARIAWEQGVQPWAARRAGIDLLHGLALVGPVAGRIPLVITVHDLSFLYYPQTFHRLKRFYLQTFTRWSVRHARRVIAISESTRGDVLRHYGLSPDRVDRIYYGLDPIFRPLPADQVAEFRAREGLPERFLLFVGTLEPRKNVARLIDAYGRLPGELPPLLLVGGKGWLYEEIYRRVEALPLGDKVRFVGYVPGERLPWWYNAAEAFVYPSLYEGFGLPPLEAMACGTPVVSSSVSSLPEVVGDAGLLVDPTDTEALAAALGRVSGDAGLRERLRAAGLAQAQRFSWAEAARQTVRSYRQALNAGGDEASV